MARQHLDVGRTEWSEGVQTDIKAYINSEERSDKRWDLFGPWFLSEYSASIPPLSAQSLNFILETFAFLPVYNLGETVNQGTSPP